LFSSNVFSFGEQNFYFEKKVYRKACMLFFENQIKNINSFRDEIKKLNIFVIGLYNFLLGQFSDLQLRSLFTYWVTPLRSLFPIKIYFQSNDKEF
jgi:hypothetical protein